MHITAVRHGQTEGNISQIIQSRADGKLTPVGITQAKETALKLQDKKFDAIYCSTLGRCRETLSYIAVYHPGVPVVYSDLLVELDKGDLEGKLWTDLPEYFYSESHIDTRIPNGESWRDVEYRIRAVLNEVCQQGFESVLIVTHDGPMRVLHAILGTVSLGEAIQVGYENAKVHELEMKTELPEGVK